MPGQSRIITRQKMEEYIELLNNGYEPNYFEQKIKFKNGDLINQFWSNHKNEIISELNNNSKYDIGYDTAKEIITRFLSEKPKQTEIKMKINEYIELLNNGYEPKYVEHNVKFKNGGFINQFWSNHKNEIISELNNNSKYEVGYETAKDMIKRFETRVLRKDKFLKNLDEYIELLNNGYIPKYCDLETKFTSGDLINQFWNNNKTKIIDKLNNDPKYEVGYEQAKNIINQLATKTSIEIKLSRRIAEYIELLNHGYVPMRVELNIKFKNGDTINKFWIKHKNEIISELNNNPKYGMGYETAKDMINMTISKSKKKKSKKVKKLKISKIQILNYLGIKVEKEIYYPLNDIIKIACFNKCVSNQNAWIKEAYYNTLNKLDKLDTLDENLIIDIITNAIIENCLEKEEREEFKQAILLYLEKVKELQKLDVAFEANTENRIEKIKEYNFDEYDIEECVLISLEFNQAKLIEPRTDLYNRRKLISSYIIDWDEFTTEEKEEIIKQNNFTIEEIALIDKKQEEIKILKKLR